MSFLFSYEVMLLRINNNLAKRSSRFLKRTMDIIGSILLIIGLSPVLLALYFMIKKDGGNAIYGHPRIGRNGKTFKCLKFISMVVNSKEVLEELLKNSPEARAEWEKDFKLKNDPRITKVGAFIRKTRLDELPQLYNVLRGDMSIIGPRPEIPEYVEKYAEQIPFFKLRHMVKPGVTGWAQIHIPKATPEDSIKKLEYDLYYIKRYSLFLDIKIVLETTKIILTLNSN